MELQQQSAQEIRQVPERLYYISGISAETGIYMQCIV